MFSFNEARDASGTEGVYIGGWSPKHVVTPEKLDGKHAYSMSDKHSRPFRSPTVLLRYGSLDSLLSTSQEVFCQTLLSYCNGTMVRIFSESLFISQSI